MSKGVDLENLATEYTAKLKEAERTVARYQRLLESVRLLQQDQLGQLPMEVLAADQAPRTVSDAVGLLLQRRAARGAQLSRMIRTEFPELATSVKDVQRSVAAALHYGYHHEKYDRKDGLYRRREP